MNYPNLRLCMRGFTLIELVITVAIVAILATIAVPSYQEQVRKTRRVDAQGALMEFSNALERRFTANPIVGYQAAAVGNANAGAPLATVFPSQAPLDGADKYYNLTVNAPTATTFTVSAAPIAGGAQAGDGNLTLTNTGIRQWDKNGAGTLIGW